MSKLTGLCQPTLYSVKDPCAFDATRWMDRESDFWVEALSLAPADPRFVIDTGLALPSHKETQQ